MLRRLPALVLRRSRCPMVRRARSGSRHHPVGIARASRLRAATRSSAGRSGLDQCPSMYASPAPTSPPSSIRTAAVVSWTWISPDSDDDGSPKTWREPSGRTTTSRPTRIRAAAPSITFRAAASRSRPGLSSRPVAAVRVLIGGPRRPARRPRGGRTARRAATGGARASGSARSSAGSAADGGRSIRSSDRSLRGTRRRTRLVLSIGAPSWRSAIESRRPSASSRTNTE